VSDETKSKRVSASGSRSTDVMFQRSQHPDSLTAKPSDYARRLAPAEATGPLTKAVVRDGVTLHAPHPTERACVGFDLEKGENVFVPRTIAYGPGCEVFLPFSEVQRLIGLRFLVDPDAEPIPVSTTGVSPLAQ